MGVKAMFNWTLWKRTCKSNYIIVLIFAAVLTMYFTIIAGMYDPENLDIVNLLAEMKLSPELLKALGFTLTDTTLLGFLSSYFYGLLMTAFPMVCYIIVGNRLIAGQVDKGSMAYLLATPNTRKKTAVTQASFLLQLVTVLVLFVTLMGVVYCAIKFPGMLDIKAFILLNLGVLLLHFALSGICFFASCLFNESKNSVMLGAGLPVAFLLLQMIANTGEKMEVVKFFTIHTLFNPLNIIHGENFILQFFILGGIAALLYICGIFIFTKKDLPI